MRNSVLIVDDIELNRDILREMLEDEYDVIEATDGEEALNIITDRVDSLAAVLLDLVMPKLNGIEVLSQLQSTGIITKIPFLVITGDDNPETECRCFELGVVDFIGKPFVTAIVKRRVSNAAQLYIYKDNLEQTVAEQTETLRQRNEQLEIQAEKLRRNYTNIIEVLGSVVEARDFESGTHVKRVKDYTHILATALLKLYPDCGLTEKTVEVIAAASPLHDVGKIMISDSVLLKRGKLTDQEREYIQTHTLLGCDLLNKTNDIMDPEYAAACYDICRSHHERWDGRGYPDHLSGDDIPLSAQIVSLADVYDALVSERVYKKAFSPEKAFEMICNGECGMFPPRIMECFKYARSEMEAKSSSAAETK